MSRNFVTLRGRLCFDTETQFTQSGATLSKNSIAVYRKKDASGNNVSDFFDLIAWGTQAETLQAIAKGSRVTLTGALEQQRWQDPETGKNRSAVQVRLTSIVETPWEDWEGDDTSQSATSQPAAARQSQPAPSQQASPKTDTPDYDDIPFMRPVHSKNSVQAELLDPFEIEASRYWPGADYHKGICPQEN